MSAAQQTGWERVGITPELRALALRIARGILFKRPPNVLRGDLEQAALCGLWDGLQKQVGRPTLDPKQLEYYLKCRIRGAIQDELRAQDWLPRYSRQRGSQVRVLFGDDVSEFARAGRNEAQVPQRWEDQLPDTEESPEEIADRLERAAVVRRAVSTLPQRERHVLRQHYTRGVKFKDIGDELRVSEPRISQLHARAITKMRDALEKEAHEDRRADGGAGAAAQEGPAQRVVERGVPRRGLGEPPAPATDRPVPGGGGGPDLGGPACEGLRGPRTEAHDASAAAPAGDGDRPVTAAEPSAGDCPEAVPSVLPEQGLDLLLELDRYRDWMVNQALLQTAGSYAAAAHMLGVHVSTVYHHRPAGTKRRGRKAALPPSSVTQQPRIHLPQELTQAPMPPAAAPAEGLRAARLSVRDRIEWDLVDQWRANGIRDHDICSRLAGRLELNKWAVEKALKAGRP